MTYAEATSYGNLANTLCALFTAYISVRSLYIWYAYLSKVRSEASENLNALRRYFRGRVVQNPPSAFPTWDLPLFTAALILCSVASVVFYFVGLAKAPPG